MNFEEDSEIKEKKVFKMYSCDSENIRVLNLYYNHCFSREEQCANFNT